MSAMTLELIRAKRALDRAREHASREFESSATDDLIDAIEALITAIEPAPCKYPEGCCNRCNGEGCANCTRGHTCGASSGQHRRAGERE